MLPFHRRQSDHHELRRHHVVSHRGPDRPQTWTFSALTCLLSLSQCTVGHRDESADHGVLRPHRRRHEPVPVARSAHFCLRGLRRLGQTVGRQGQHVPADVHRSRVRHQRHLCEYDMWGPGELEHRLHGEPISGIHTMMSSVSGLKKKNRKTPLILTPAPALLRSFSPTAAPSPQAPTTQPAGCLTCAPTRSSASTATTTSSAASRR